MMWEGINQRKFPRANYKCLIKVQGAGEEELVDTYTENIGGGGLCVILDKDFGLFSTVSLEVYLAADSEPIVCNGTIVWVVKRHPVLESDPIKFDTGIEFQDMTEDDREKVSRLVQDILKADLDNGNPA